MRYSVNVPVEQAVVKQLFDSMPTKKRSQYIADIKNTLSGDGCSFPIEAAQTAENIALPATSGKKLTIAKIREKIFLNRVKGIGNELNRRNFSILTYIASNRGYKLKVNYDRSELLDLNFGQIANQIRDRSEKLRQAVLDGNKEQVKAILDSGKVSLFAQHYHSLTELSVLNHCLLSSLGLAFFLPTSSPEDKTVRAEIIQLLTKHPNTIQAEINQSLFDLIALERPFITAYKDYTAEILDLDILLQYSFYEFIITFMDAVLYDQVDESNHYTTLSLMLNYLERACTPQRPDLRPLIGTELILAINYGDKNLQGFKQFLAHDILLKASFKEKIFQPLISSRFFETLDVDTFFEAMQLLHSKNQSLGARAIPGLDQFYHEVVRHLSTLTDLSLLAQYLNNKDFSKFLSLAGPGINATLLELTKTLINKYDFTKTELAEQLVKTCFKHIITHCTFAELQTLGATLLTKPEDDKLRAAYLMTRNLYVKKVIQSYKFPRAITANLISSVDGFFSQEVTDEKSARPYHELAALFMLKPDIPMPEFKSKAERIIQGLILTAREDITTSPSKLNSLVEEYCEFFTWACDNSEITAETVETYTSIARLITKMGLADISPLLQKANSVLTYNSKILATVRAEAEAGKAELRRQLHDKTTTLTQRDAAIEKHDQEIERIKERAKQKIAEIKNVATTQIAKLETELAQLQSTVGSDAIISRPDHEAIVDSLKAQIKELEQALAKITKEQTQLQAKFASQTENYSALRAKFIPITAIKEDAEKQAAILLAQITQLQGELTSAKAEKRDMTNELATLQSKVEELTKARTAAAATEAALKQDLVATNATIAELRERVTHLNAAIIAQSQVIIPVSELTAERSSFAVSAGTNEVASPYHAVNHLTLGLPAIDYFSSLSHPLASTASRAYHNNARNVRTAGDGQSNPPNEATAIVKATLGLPSALPISSPHAGIGVVGLEAYSHANKHLVHTSASNHWPSQGDSSKTILPAEVSATDDFLATAFSLLSPIGRNTASPHLS
jgi:hypothetical protein